MDFNKEIDKTRSEVARILREKGYSEEEIFKFIRDNEQVARNIGMACATIQATFIKYKLDRFMQIAILEQIKYGILKESNKMGDELQKLMFSKKEEVD